MKLLVCGQAGSRAQDFISYVVNDRLALDAGVLTGCFPLERQRQIRHVLLSHCHLDHVASLPLLTETLCAASRDEQPCLTVYAGPYTLQQLRLHVFNNKLYPDVFGLAEQPGSSLSGRLAWKTLEKEKPVRFGSLEVVPVELNHVVPCLGFVVREPGCAVALVSDTGPTERVWELLQKEPDLKAVLVEVSFPNRLRALADVSAHLTPELLQQELHKLNRAVKCLVVHVKLPYVAEIEQELQAVDWPDIELAQPGQTYCW